MTERRNLVAGISAGIAGILKQEKHDQSALEFLQSRPPLPKGIRALELLQMVYRGEYQATPQEMRAAIAALDRESPRVSAVAIATMDGKSFAEALDRAIEQSKGGSLMQNAPTIEHGPVEQLPASELKKPFRRNYRRF